MSAQRYDVVDASEDACKEAYSVGVFAFKLFYQVSTLEALKNSMDAYMLSSFSQRLEYFTYEHNKLSNNEKKAFYDDLKSNKQNVNYLYTVVESARTTTHEIHAQLLARLSVELIKNKEFNFYENALIANLHTLTNDDLLIYKNVMNGFLEDKIMNIGSSLIFETIEHRSFISIQKFLNIGIISIPHSAPQKPIYDDAPNENHNFRRRMFFVVGEYSINLLNMLNELADE
jgi:hypothetical protein